MEPRNHLPDMRADRDDDPRAIDGIRLDGELATSRVYPMNSRLTVTMKCEGVDREQVARPSVPPTAVSLLGLLRHLAEAERD